MNKFDLKELGLKDNIIKEFKSLYEGMYLGRVACEQKNYYKVITEKGVISARVSGKIMYNACSIASYPAVGDWVAMDRDEDSQGEAIIHGTLERYSKFSRKTVGPKDDEQIIAVNIDIVFITMSLNNNFNLRRLERYISTAWESGAKPIVLLTKADLCEDLDEKLLEVSKVAIGVDILVVSSLTNEGIDKVKDYITKGKTVAFIGSSGVGKSTLINKFLGYEKMKVSEIRECDGKGRHTTTYRELLVIPKGGVVIDTPGMRELPIMDIEDGIESAFRDIEELTINCRFGNCTHNEEPGCAVKEAISKGIISEKRYKSYIKLKKEAEFMAKKEKIKKVKESKKGKMKKNSCKKDFKETI
ncbi:ribosome small subunit-dependent GTPase A [Haloimpatiens massiliensis]|uniref:ribosome small subunit-dependent GTPase A n=1 Tax=Haloimpatiens massiliensis TaxID=1658110 RepID=UPI000C84CA74|nr:ribosome small subunit-dependent GTPase A [Haloimpatiens massiliensis]